MLSLLESMNCRFRRSTGIVFLRMCKATPQVYVNYVMKTLVNAWSTSDRYHENIVHRCLFGCPNCVDSLAHYLHCDFLWAILATASSTVPRATPLERLCIVDPGYEGVLQLSLAFVLYHRVKHDQLDLFLAMSQDRQSNMGRFLEVCSDVVLGHIR